MHGPGRDGRRETRLVTAPLRDSLEGMTAGSNRGFWSVIIPVAAAGTLLVVLIVLNRPTGGPAKGSPATEANLRTALAAAKAMAAQEGSYTAATPLALAPQEPSLVFIGGDEASNDPGVISVSFTPSAWVGAARSSSGTCYWIRDELGMGATYGISTDCAADHLRTATGSANGWVTS